MSTLLEWFTSPEWAQVVKALLHSLWEGAVIAAVLAMVLRRLSNPVARYRSALGALAVVVFVAIVTWAVINAEGHRSTPEASKPPTQPSNNNAATVAEPDSTPETVVVMGRPTPAIPWTAWLAFGWLAGAMLMLARAGVKVAGAEQLRRSCRPLEDARIEALIAETRRALGVANRIRVGVTDKLTSPAVVGVVVPMLILPLALMTSLTPEQVRFVLLHELAHIRRRDYLANLFQFFAESLLFFNPAVWWVSHQIRREREACCDALATELSGAPADYAQTLVQVAEKILYSPPAAAPAFGDKREPSRLAERIQRLLVPGYRPSLRLTWRAMLAALASGSVLLFLSAIGTRLTVAAILTPQQRIAVIEKKMEEYGQKPPGAPGSPNAQEPLIVTAHFRTPDGSPFPSKRMGAIYSVTDRANSVGSVNITRSGTISNTVARGQIWVGAYVDGFAPDTIGPIDGTDTNRLDLGEVVLNRGFDVSIRITDATSGKAIPNAALHTQFWIRGANSTVQEPLELKADSEGKTTLSHCADQPVTISINAPGYEIVDQRFEDLHPSETLKITLKQGAEIAGIVTDKTTGQPIAGATVRIIYQKGVTSQHYEWNDPIRLLATTGDDGRFLANQLQPNTIYWLGISAPGHESIILSNLPTGERDVNARLGPELIVHGEVIGDVKGLQRMDNHYALYRSWADVFESSSWGSGDGLPLEDVGGVMRFVFTNRTAGNVTITDEKGHTFEREVDAPIENWTIDLNEAPKTAMATNVPKREVIFRFKNASGVPPQGTVSVQVPDNLDTNHLTAHSETLQITNGEVRAEIAIGGRTSIEPAAMIGYWFSQFGNNNSFFSIQVTNGPGPMIIDVPVIPAGAIYAKARDADGSPAGGLLFGVEELKRAPDRGDNTPLNNNSDNVSGSAPRKWVSGPLPLGGTYRITAWRGNSFCVSKPVTLTEENPIAEVELQLGPGKTLEGAVLDANGHPVANSSLQPMFTLSQNNSFSLTPVFTDEDGHFRMENVTPGIGEYTVEVEVPGMMAERAKLDFGTQPQIIRLKRGLGIAGRLVEAGTGNIIPAAGIRAMDIDNLALPTLATHTDAEGHFEFTELGAGSYEFFVECGEQTASQQTYRGDVDTNITLAVKLYPWSTAKPQPPPPTAKEKAMTFLQDGKVLFQLGRLDEAESKLRQVLRFEPDNQAAQYYLGRVEQSRATDAEHPVF